MRFYFDIKDEELHSVYEVFTQFKDNNISLATFLSDGIEKVNDVVTHNKYNINKQVVAQSAKEIAKMG